MRRMLRWMWIVFVPVIGVWVFAVLGVWWGQERLIFPVPTIDADDLARMARHARADVHHPVAADGTRLYAWHLRGDGDRLLLYFHGNGGDVSAASWFAQELPGWDIVSFSYRGYPGSQGAPSEAGMVLDAQAIWRWVTEDLGFAPDRVVVHAQSLGGGVSAHLLTEVRPAAVVWDSTFHSLEELARGVVPGAPTAWMLRHPFRTFQRAPRIAAPVLLLHGAADTLIPVDHARRNAKLLPQVTYIELDGLGHGDWLPGRPEAHATWHAFVMNAVPPHR